jgi:hypothetical protein
LYLPPNIIRVTKSRRVRWAGHAACSEEERCVQFWWERLKEKERLEDLVVERTIILKCVFNKWDGGMGWTDLARERDSSCECSKESQVSKISGGFFC